MALALARPAPGLLPAYPVFQWLSLMNDLSERDLSGIADADLSSEERGEIRRRFDSFLARMQIRRLARPGRAATPGAQPAEPAKPRKPRLARWSPKVLRRSR